MVTWGCIRSARTEARNMIFVAAVHTRHPALVRLWPATLESLKTLPPRNTVSKQILMRNQPRRWTSFGSLPLGSADLYRAVARGIARDPKDRAHQVR